jgi:hypothetical protein
MRVKVNHVVRRPVIPNAGLFGHVGLGVGGGYVSGATGHLGGFVQEVQVHLRSHQHSPTQIENAAPEAGTICRV